jgi:hypothetical protein
MSRLDIDDVRIRLARGEDFDGLDLSGLDLSGWPLQGARFQGARLRKTRLVETDLSEAVLADADLEGAWLVGAKLDRAHLQHADLHGADLSTASLVGAHAGGADLSSTILIGADLSEADLSFADLSDTTVLQTVLTGTRLMGTDLTRARMGMVNLLGVDFAGANLTGASVLPVLGKKSPRSSPPEDADPDRPESWLRAVMDWQSPLLGDERDDVLRGVRRGLHDYLDEERVEARDVRESLSLLRGWLDQVVERRQGELWFDDRGAGTLFDGCRSRARLFLKLGWERAIALYRKQPGLLDLADEIVLLEAHLDLLRKAERSLEPRRPALATTMRRQLEVGGDRYRAGLRFQDDKERASEVVVREIEGLAERDGIDPALTAAAVGFFRIWIDVAVRAVLDTPEIHERHCDDLLRSVRPELLPLIRSGCELAMARCQAYDATFKPLVVVHEALHRVPEGGGPGEEP